MNARRSAVVRAASAGGREAVRDRSSLARATAQTRGLERRASVLVRRIDEQRVSEPRRSGITVKGPAPYETLERGKGGKSG